MLYTCYEAFFLKSILITYLDTPPSCAMAKAPTTVGFVAFFNKDSKYERVAHSWRTSQAAHSYHREQDGHPQLTPAWDCPVCWDSRARPGPPVLPSQSVNLELTPQLPTTALSSLVADYSTEHTSTTTHTLF